MAVQVRKALKILIGLYICANIFGLLASLPMIKHVYEKSECILFSHEVTKGGSLSYGHHASCNVVGYVFLFVVCGGAYLIFKCYHELRMRKGHAKAGHFEDQRVPKIILYFHLAITALALILTVTTTSGYVAACNNLHNRVSKSVGNLLNDDPYETLGEHIQTRFEDNYKFHRYTNTYGNAFGENYYQISITCRSVLTDPEIYQQLLTSHLNNYGRYYGYWYGQDLASYDPQTKASETNALVESSLAGSWLCFASLIAGLILMLVQRITLKKEAEAVERMSVHSTMMGGNGTLNRDGSVAGTFPRNGSLMSGSNFQRGGSTRGSDRSIKSTRRDIDDIALSMHHMGGSQHLLSPAMQLHHGGAMHANASSGYGRKEIDDMVNNTEQQQQQPNNRFNNLSNIYRTEPSRLIPLMTNSSKHIFKRENSLQLEVEQPHGIMILNGDGLLKNNQGSKVLNQHIAQNSQGARPFNGHQYPSHFSSRETGYNSGNEPSTHAPGGFRYQDPESTHHYREEVETEIF